MSYAEGLSASDVALLSNSGRNDGWGNEGGAWWIIIFLIFALGGFRGNGWGNNQGGGIADNYVLASDFATLQRQLDSGFDRIGNRIENVNNGLCDGFYAMNTGMLNGFGGVQQTLCQGFSGVNQAISNSAFNTERGLWNLSSQFADCCCQTQRAIDGVNYNMAMNTNALQNTMCNTTRDLIENQNANYRALHDEIVANRIEDKNAQITAQQNEINALRLAASQERQNSFLIDQLKPCPIPAYITCNPYQSYNYTGCNGGCNCGNF